MNKHLSLASNASQNPMSSGLWGHMLISTNIFNKTIFTVSGIDMSVFIDQWVRTGGHAKFTCTFVFNRKRYKRDSLGHEYLLVLHNIFLV